MGSWRNPCFKYFFVVVLLVVAYFYTTDVLPLGLAVRTPPLVIWGAYLWFALCLWLFLAGCTSDPGVITSESWHRFKDVYQFDEMLYLREAECWTCQLKKTARSKHCATCNHCVFRFDHHCTWLNNCVGGLNARLFMALVASLTAGTGSVSYSIGTTLFLHAESSRLLHASYVGPDGRLRPVSWQVAVQHLFMERPMPVFIMMSLALLCLLVAAFLVYHLFLAVTNQTTNERYKRSRLAASQDHCTSCLSAANTVPTKNRGNHRKRKKDRRENICYRENIYDRGLVSNLKEIIFPLVDTCR